MKQIQSQYAKEILNSIYGYIVTSTKHKYYIMEDSRSLKILQAVMDGNKLMRRKDEF